MRCSGTARCLISALRESLRTRAPPSTSIWTRCPSRLAAHLFLLLICSTCFAVISCYYISLIFTQTLSVFIQGFGKLYNLLLFVFAIQSCQVSCIHLFPLFLYFTTIDHYGHSVSESSWLPMEGSDLCPAKYDSQIPSSRTVSIRYLLWRLVKLKIVKKARKHTKNEIFRMKKIAQK